MHVLTHLQYTTRLKSTRPPPPIRLQLLSEHLFDPKAREKNRTKPKDQKLRTGPK